MQKQFVRNVMLLFGGSAVAQMIPVAVSPLITRLFLPDDFGAFSLYLTLVGLGSILATFRLESAVLLPASSFQAFTVASASAGIATTASLLFACVMIVLLIGGVHVPFWMWLLPAGVMLNALFMIAMQWLNRLRLYSTMSGGRIVQAAGVALLSILAGMFGLEAIGLIGAHLLGVLFLMLLWRRLVPFSRPFGSFKAVVARYRAFPLFNMPHAFLGALSTSLPMVMLPPAFGMAVAGWYALGARVLQVPAMMLAQSIANVFNKEAAVKVHRKEPLLPLIRKIAFKILVWMLVPALLLVWQAPVIFSLLFGEGWREAGEYVTILTPMVFLSFFAALFAYVPVLMERQKGALNIEIVSAAAKAGGLGIGIVYADAKIALGAFAFMASLAVLYKIVWMYRLCAGHDHAVAGVGA